MAKKVRRIGSLKRELIEKSREAALTAIRIYNDPQVTFKSESFIVLMVIAWTYLLHAYYRSKKVEYRYFKQRGKKRFFDKTKYGACKYWELERCLNDIACPVKKDSANNLRFLIGLRNEIEHQMTLAIDSHMSGRFQACAINYNDYVKELFGQKYSIDSQVAYSIQFSQLSEKQFSELHPESEIPNRLRSYITKFDDTLSHDECNSPRYSFRILFRKILVNRSGQADRVIEFIDPKSDAAKTIDKEHWIKKEVEKQKYRATDVVTEVTKAGFKRFRINPEHVRFWKEEDAKNPAKGYGTEIQGSWFWYQSWVDRCIELCNVAGEQFK